jgi:cephalosporin hydroxylase
MDYTALANTAALSMGALLQVPNELIPFMEFLDKEKPKNFLELGICQGATFYIWCTIMEPGGIKLGIDLPNGPWGAPYTRTEKEIEASKHIFQTIAPNCHVRFDNTQSEESVTWVSEKLNGQQLDFLFIDADHTYEGAKADYEKYSKFVRKGGAIVLHDIKDTERHRKGQCEVYKFWNELEGDKKEFIDATYDWGGIGVIIKK